MSPLLAKETFGPALDPVPEGVHIATCYGVIDLGIQHNQTFNNEAHKVLIQWELPDCRGEFERDGQMLDLPRAISQRYTVSLNDKANLRRDLESWRGRRFTAEEMEGFDLKNLLGVPCQLQVVHETSRDGTKVYANVASIMALPRGTPKPQLENEPIFFSFEDLGDSWELPEDLPEWILKILKESSEYRNLTQSVPVPAEIRSADTRDIDDGVPF